MPDVSTNHAITYAKIKLLGLSETSLPREPLRTSAWGATSQHVYSAQILHVMYRSILYMIPGRSSSTSFGRTNSRTK